MLKGLTLAPEDIDSNDIYALYLFGHGEDNKTPEYLNLAYVAANRIGRHYADETRRKEMLILMREQKNNK